MLSFHLKGQIFCGHSIFCGCQKNKNKQQPKTIKQIILTAFQDWHSSTDFQTFTMESKKYESFLLSLCASDNPGMFTLPPAGEPVDIPLWAFSPDLSERTGWRAVTQASVKAKVRDFCQGMCWPKAMPRVAVFADDTASGCFSLRFERGHQRIGRAYYMKTCKINQNNA